MTTTERLDSEFLAFASWTAPAAGAAIVLACAKHGAAYWQQLFHAGLCKGLPNAQEQEADLLATLCLSPDLPHAAPILDAYLTHMSGEWKARHFAPGAVKSRSHFANNCFTNASFRHSGGSGHCERLEILIRHGVPIEVLARRNCEDLHRAASLAHRSFLMLVVPKLAHLDDGVIQYVVRKSARVVEALHILINDCRVPLDRFITTKNLSCASQEARSYLLALHARRR